MATFLFSETVFGPVKSRRLGNSLGINLLPNDCKVCNFNCIYCECGWTHLKHPGKLLPSKEIEKQLSHKLKNLKENEVPVDTITFAGNGEPTMHPGFGEIVEFTLHLRDKFYPKAKVAVLSNATMLEKGNVMRSLKKVDLNILKLDSVFQETMGFLNEPPKNFTVKKLIGNLKSFDGKFILQTMFIRGIYNGKCIDNTSERELKGWLETIKLLKPKMVMIYTIRRDTPVSSLQAISSDELENISRRVSDLGFEVMVSA